jgi:hypothetical protein
MKTDTVEERKVIRVERHFGGKHRTTHYSDGTTCNVYEDGYRSASDLVDRSKLSLITTNNTMNKTNTNKSVSVTARRKVDTENPTTASAKTKSRRKVSESPAPETASEPKTPKVKVVSPAAQLKAEVLAKLTKFHANPPSKPLTVKEIVAAIGSSHRQVYVFIAQHGKPAGTSDIVGRGQKAKLFTFEKTAE